MFDSLFPKHWTTLQRLMWLKANALARAVYETITGNPVTFTALASPLRKLQIAFSPVQSGSGDPSPDNVRPISGWDSLNVWQTGVNLFDGEWENGNISDSTGQNSGTSTSYFRSKNYIPVPHGTQFYWYHPTRKSNFRQFFYDENKNYLGYYGRAWNSLSPLTGATFYDRIVYVRFRVSDSTGRAENDDKISINYPATDTAYHAYNPSSRSISIPFGSTYYSGTVDVLTGVLKVRPYFASYNGETLVGPWMSSMDKYVAGATPTVGAQVVDMGGAETTIQLTPQEVSSLLGENNMWSDANGNLTVTYAADPATTPIVGKGKVGQAVI